MRYIVYSIDFPTMVLICTSYVEGWNCRMRGKVLDKNRVACSSPAGCTTSSSTSGFTKADTCLFVFFNLKMCQFRTKKETTRRKTQRTTRSTYIESVDLEEGKVEKIWEKLEERKS